MEFTNSFFLHRIKKNIRVNLKDDKQNIYFSNIGVELLDISVPNKEDTYHYNNNLLDEVERKKYNRVDINVFNIEGLIKDYFKMLFVQSKYPWENQKYEKRILRFLILFVMYNIDNLTELNNLIISISKNQNNNLTKKLNIGLIENLNKLNDLSYYNSQMENYSKFIKNIITKFKEFQKKISSTNTNDSIIRKIGSNKKDDLSKMKREVLLYNLITDKNNGIEYLINFYSILAEDTTWNIILKKISPVIKKYKRYLSRKRF